MYAKPLMIGLIGVIEKVVGDTTHNLSYLGIVEICIRKLVKMGIGIAAHIGFHSSTHNMTYIGHMGLAENVKVRERMLEMGLADENTKFIRLCTLSAFADLYTFPFASIAG